MADVLTMKNIQMQLTDGSGVKSSVNFATSDTAVKMANGATLKQWAGATDKLITAERIKLFSHMSQQHLTASEISGLLVDSEYDEATGKLKFTTYDGKTKTLNTALNKIAVNFTMRKGDNTNEAEAGKVFLVLTLEDGSTMEVDVTSLVDIYEGSEGTSVIVTVDENKHINATLVDGSIPLTKLEQEVQDKILETYTLPVAGEGLGGIKASETISVDGETGIANADVVFYDGVRMQLNLTPYNARQLVALRATIKNTSSLVLEDGTVGIECFTNETKFDPSATIYKYGGNTVLYIRKVDVSAVNVFTAIELNVAPVNESTTTSQNGSVTPIYGTAFSEAEREYTANLADAGFTVEAGANYEVYLAHSVHIAETNTDKNAFEQVTVTSPHKFITYTGQTVTP